MDATFGSMRCYRAGCGERGGGCRAWVGDIRSGVAEYGRGQMVTSEAVLGLIYRPASGAVARRLSHVVFVIYLALPRPFRRNGLRGSLFVQKN